MIEILKADITTLEVDAIVNAANKTMLGGGGVDRAIHEAAGPELLLECQALNGCETGDAKITKGYRLKAKYIIHTVGPVWHGGENQEVEKLASCYKKSLELALTYNLKEIAFPCIGTGIYRFPKELAASTAIREVKKFLKNQRCIEKIIFVPFDMENYNIYTQKLKWNE